MCAPCEASKARLYAAATLRAVVEERYGLGPALKTVFAPEPLPEAMRDLLAKLYPG